MAPEEHELKLFVFNLKDGKPLNWSEFKDYSFYFLDDVFDLKTSGLGKTNVNLVWITSEGRAKVQDCWNGQDPELRTWILKSTETEKNRVRTGLGLGLNRVRGSGSYSPEAPSC